jgi:hypothetical protein
MQIQGVRLRLIYGNSKVSVLVWLQLQTLLENELLAGLSALENLPGSLILAKGFEWNPLHVLREMPLSKLGVVVWLTYT